MPIIFPKVSSTMEEGRVVEWLVPQGKRVAKDEVIAIIESDKASVELTMPQDGILECFLVEAGAMAMVGAPIALLQGEKREPTATPPKTAPQELTEQEPAITQEKKSRSPNVAISPAARRRARELAIDFSSLRGTGPAGRITYRDIEQARQPAIPEGTSKSGALSPMRRAIAKRMEHSVRTIPQFSITFAADMSNVMTIKQAIQNSLSNRGIKLSLTDFIIRATAESLQEHSGLNASFVGSPHDEGGHIIKHPCANAGLAVALDGGLAVPVIHEAERLTVAEIASQRATRLKRLREGSCPENYFQGGTFTISNLGAFGVQQFQAIINPPEAFILAVGAVCEEVVAHGEKMEVRPLMRITGTFDHRITDGAPAAAFMRDLVRRLESREWVLV